VVCEGPAVDGRAFRVAFFLAFRRPRAASSFGSALVTKALQVCVLKLLNWRPRSAVHCWSQLTDDSVCIRSLAKVCHSASVNRREAMASSCGSGSNPSNTGIAHYGKQWL
jgi:hypothetical protein